MTIDGPNCQVHTCSMRTLAFLMIYMAAIGSAQEGSSDKTTPLSRDQEAVYRAALSRFEKGSPYEVIDLTGVLRPEEGDYAGCIKISPRPQALKAFID